MSALARSAAANLAALNPPFPRDRPEFAQWFGDEESCLAYLAALRWQDGFSCPKCEGKEAWIAGAGLRRCKSCRRWVSVTAGTLLHRSRKPIRDWFEAVWHLCGQKNGGSALGLQRSLGFGSYHTSWEWLHRMRRAVVLPARLQLTEEVEVDETFVGGVKTGKRGRGAAGKSLVLIAAEVRGVRIGRIRLLVIPDSTATTLISTIEDLVERGSNVVTDGLSSYAGLTKRGYHHTISRHAPEVGGNLLPHVHRVAALLKRWLLGTHQGAVSHQRLQVYLDEFEFRFNRRAASSRGLLFHRLLVQVLKNGPIPRARL